ncbi:MAG TPA: histidine kinase [Tetrasphaera sp.]|uniref:sensor histidine kinase n=1 Tax=Nostocoides sp. TaxID=1917966 RepID=UPI002BFBD5BA|nr:histidine kinase [Tetrasphaera sp.]HNQ05975.1 histidine kinase [Tetrasphaera sp.]
MPEPSALRSAAPVPEAGAGAAARRWHTFSTSATREAEPAAISPRRIFTQLFAVVLVLLLLVGGASALVARSLAEREAVSDAADLADVLAEAVVQPAMTKALADGDPAAVHAFDALIHERMLARNVVRVKLWTDRGRILYADEPKLVGEIFALSEEQREVLRNPQTHAEISRLTESENAFEHADRLVEVYRPVWFPDKTTALFEIYVSYNPVGDRTATLWRSFAALTMASLVLLAILPIPFLWHLLGRLRRGERLRADLSERALDASARERRRIAATLHDGPVQELAATSFAIAGGAAAAQSRGDVAAARDLGDAATVVRRSIRSLRTLLVDIYPPSLEHSGLEAALTDLAQGVRGEGVAVRVHLDPGVEDRLGAKDARLVFRVTQECLRNAGQHAGPATVQVRLAAAGPQAVLDIVDDGVGFDIAAALADPAPGHFGLRVLSDLAGEAGARLEVASELGAGTHWRLTVTPTKESS